MPTLYNENIDNLVRADFYQACEDIAANTTAQSEKFAKYFQLQGGDSLNQQNDAKKREAFLERKHFDHFFNELIENIARLDENDIEKLGRPDVTPKGKAFYQCMNLLNESGFYHANGRPINFWSGEEAHLKAEKTPTSLADTNISSICILIALANSLAKYGEISAWSKLIRISSAFFASQATDSVELYISSDESNKTKLGLTADNFFWNAELGKIMQSEVVKKINIFTFNNKENQWEFKGNLKDPNCYNTLMVSSRRDPDLQVPWNQLLKIAQHWKQKLKKKSPAEKKQAASHQKSYPNMFKIIGFFETKSQLSSKQKAQTSSLSADATAGSNKMERPLLSTNARLILTVDEGNACCRIDLILQKPKGINCSDFYYAAISKGDDDALEVQGAQDKGNSDNFIITIKNGLPMSRSCALKSVALVNDEIEEIKQLDNTNDCGSKLTEEDLKTSLDSLYKRNSISLETYQSVYKSVIQLKHMISMKPSPRMDNW